MKENYLEKLEFNKIAEILSTFCITHSGKNIALNIEPSNISDKVKQTLAETNEAVSVLYKCGIPPIKEVSNNTEAIKILDTIKDSYNVIRPDIMVEVANKLYKKSVDPSIIENRFNCIDLMYQLSLYRILPESKEKAFLTDLNDMDELLRINDIYFRDNPINLDKL